MTPQLHNRGRANTSQYQSLPEFSQSGACVGERPVCSIGVFAATPQNLSSGTGTRPDHAVEVYAVDLFAPGMDFATEDQLGLIWVKAGNGVITVDCDRKIILVFVSLSK